MLREAFAEITREAQGLQQEYLPRMREQARTLDPARVMALVRGR